MKRALIIGSGEVHPEKLKELLHQSSFIICADGGASALLSRDVLPDILLGDFDSIEPEILSHYKDRGVEIIKYPSEKDETDSEIALEIAKDRGYTSIDFIGGMGTRFDHTLANAMLTQKALDEGMDLRLHDKTNLIMALRTIKIEKSHMYLSMIALTKDCVVSIEGVKYPLRHVNIAPGSTLGISNEIVDEKASIQLHSGNGLLILSED